LSEGKSWDEIATFFDYGANTADRSDDEVDILLITSPNASANRQEVVRGMRAGLINDLRIQPNQ
jgi:hypothetical protein